MTTKQTPPKKAAPKPTEVEKILAKHFEFQMVDEAITQYEQKEYLKAAMLSWAFIEEFFLPTMIKRIARNQKIKFEDNLIVDAPVMQLVKYYYFISYDEELFDLLTEGRKLRNKLVHKMYRSGSLATLDDIAEKSAYYNLTVLVNPIMKRLAGEIIPPSLNLYPQGWNDLRDKMQAYIKKREAQLNEEFKQAHSKRTSSKRR